jgi:hypothetical protein
LRESSGVDCIVDLTTGFSGSNSRVDGCKTGGFSLGFTSTSGIDDGVGGTTGCLSFDESVDVIEDRSGGGELKDGEEGEEGEELEHLDKVLIGLE